MRYDLYLHTHLVAPLLSKNYLNVALELGITELYLSGQDKWQVSTKAITCHGLDTTSDTTPHSITQDDANRQTTSKKTVIDVIHAPQTQHL